MDGVCWRPWVMVNGNLNFGLFFVNPKFFIKILFRSVLV
jgi:hypothetical protein